MPALAERGADIGTQEITVALHVESRLLDELLAVLIRQREAIARNDVPSVDAATQTISRMVLTLDEARRHRERVVALVTERAPNGEWELDGDSALDAARESVRRRARVVSRTLSTNQDVLRRAIKAGDAYLQALFASAGEPLSGYRRNDSHTDSAVNGGVVVDTRA